MGQLQVLIVCGETEYPLVSTFAHFCYIFTS